MGGPLLFSPFPEDARRDIEEIPQSNQPRREDQQVQRRLSQGPVDRRGHDFTHVPHRSFTQNDPANSDTITRT